MNTNNIKNYKTMVANKNIYLLGFFIFLILSQSLFSQAKKYIFALAKGDSVVLISTISPKSDGGINFYKKGPAGQFVLLNTDGPVKPIINSDEILKLFGDRWPAVKGTLSINDPADLVYLVGQDQNAFLFISFKYPEIFKIAGAMFVDMSKDRKSEEEYKVEILDNNRTIKDSFTGKVKIKESAPVSPKEVVAIVQKKEIEIKWKYPAFDINNLDYVTQFNIYRKAKEEEFKKINDDIIARGEKEELFFVDNNIESNIEYSYYIAAVDVIGTESNPSTQTKATWVDNIPPSIPDELKADSISGAIGISWKMNLELDAKGYNIYRSTESDKNFIKLNQDAIPVDKSFYYDSDFKFGQQYFYRVTCVDNNGNESEKSNHLSIVYEDLIAPEPPTSVAYKIENRLIKLTWNPSKSLDVEGYHFYRGEQKENIPRVTATVIKSTSYTDSGITGKGFELGKKYVLAISAYDKGRNESQKVFLEDVFIPDDEAPAPPENFFAENKNANYVDISCGGSISLDVSQYKLYKAELDTPNSEREIANFKNTPYRYSDTSVVKTKGYIYYAVAIDKAGNISKKSRIDTVILKDMVPPPSPREVIAKKVEGGIEITWEKVFEYDLAGYNVYKSDLPNGFFKKINKEIVVDTKFIDSNGKTTEFFRVRAIDTSGNESTKGDYASPE